jgi:alpha-tubulin suppressor-like RCC1 family protein
VVPLGVQDVKAVTMGSVSLCVLTEQNVVLCKGENLFGQLGNLEPSTFGTPSDIFVPAQGEYGAPLVQLGSLENTHYALASSGQVFCWGIDEDIGSAGGGYYCNHQGDNPATPLSARVVGKPRALTSPDTVSALAGGSRFACVVRADGRTMCWGRNYLGQLGRGTTSSSEYVAFTLGLGATRSVSLGHEHACAVTTDDKLFCWGRNDFGQLGAPCGLTLPCQTTVEGTSYVSVPTRVLEGVVDVQSGYDFSCTRKLDATVACWGSNATGQLGNGTKSAGESTPKPILWK